MKTREVIQGYFDSLTRKSDWQSFLADDIVFTSYTSPPKTITGKQAFLDATKRFYSTVTSVTVKDLLIDGEKACALTHYELRPPAGSSFTSDVAEIFTVKDGKIISFAIYFDSLPFPK